MRNGICGILLLTVFAGSARAEEPYPDPELESRLVTRSTYTTRPGDTLVGIAYLLYGHRTWWSRLRDENAQTAQSLGPQDPLPVGTRLSYRAPIIGDDYVVQPNDWLIRIVEWKYGARDHWVDVFKKNAGRIANPNLIHPGDRLALGLDGTVANVGTGEVLMPSEPALAPPAEPQPMAVTPVEPARDVASLNPPQEDFQGNPFFYGFAAGVAMLLLMPLVWFLRRPKLVEPAPTVWIDAPEKEKPKKRRPREDGKGYPYTFERGPKPRYSLDKSLVRRDGQYVERKPGYHTLLKFIRRKFSIHE